MITISIYTLKFLKWMLIGLIGFWLSGCAAPMLLGVKSYQSGNTKIEFITGADFSIGANGINNVNNNRGIK